MPCCQPPLHATAAALPHLLPPQLLYHRCLGAASPLAPYLATLPGVARGIPTPQVAMLWPPAELQQLQHVPLQEDAGGQAYWWQAYSRDVLAQLPGSPDDAFGGQAVGQERLGA